MTDKEIQHFLNILLPDLDNQKRSKTANEKLSDDEKERLCVIAKKLCSDKILEKKEWNKFLETAAENPESKQILWKEFYKTLTNGFMEILVQIADILKNIGYNQNLKRTVRKNDKGIIFANDKTTPTVVSSGYTNMPFLIKQVLYLFSVRILQANYAFDEPYYNLKDVFEELHNVHNISISHNFLSDMFGKITPTMYWRWIKYNQPENPLKYMGQKKERLGVAIKHLVGQAELDSKYDCYVDLFGGSSSATVAPVYKKNVTYIYNDIDRLLANYVEVVASDSMYQKLIDKIVNLQNFIEFSFSKQKGDYERFDERIAAYLNSPEDFSVQTCFTSEVKERIEDIRKNGQVVPAYKTKDIEEFLKGFKKQVLDKMSESELQMQINDFANRGGKTYTIDDVKKFSTATDFNKNKEVIRYLMLKNDLRKNPLWNMKGICNKERLTTSIQPCLIDKKLDIDMVEAEWMYQQYRVLGILIECKRLYYKEYESEDWYPKNKDDKIKAALVLILMNQFRTNNEIGSDSSVTLYLKHDTTIHRFIEKDYRGLITEYHKSIRRVKKKNIHYKKYSYILKKYSGKDKSTLFYVDSPYVGTKAYQKNETQWDFDDMKKLIKELFDSEQRFIFSMRACKDDNSYETDETEETEETEKKISDVNKKILGVFRYFDLQEKKINKTYMY